MGNVEDTFVTLVYLWTRDAGMPPDEATANYVRQHLLATGPGALPAIYSDKPRAEMAKILVAEVLIGGSRCLTQHP